MACLSYIYTHISLLGLICAACCMEFCASCCTTLFGWRLSVCVRACVFECVAQAQAHSFVVFCCASSGKYPQDKSRTHTRTAAPLCPPHQATGFLHVILSGCPGCRLGLPGIALTQFSTWDAKLRDLQIILEQTERQCVMCCPSNCLSV